MLAEKSQSVDRLPFLASSLVICLLMAEEWFISRILLNLQILTRCDPVNPNQTC